MIKNLNVVFFVFISLCAKAQIKQGTVLVGGQISAGKSKRDINYTSYPIYPNYQNDELKYVNAGISLGKAIRENNVIGFNFNTANYKQTISYNSIESGVAKINMNEVGVFYRSYKKIGKDIYFFGQANAFVNFGKTQNNFTNSINNSNTKSTGGSLSLTPGLAYALCKKLHLELSMQNLVTAQYSISKQQFTNTGFQTSKNEAYGINSSLGSGMLGNISIGFRLML